MYMEQTRLKRHIPRKTMGIAFLQCFYNYEGHPEIVKMMNDPKN
jgi:hypothetical protein